MSESQVKIEVRLSSKHPKRAVFLNVGFFSAYYNDCLQISSLMHKKPAKIRKNKIQKIYKRPEFPVGFI